MIGLFAAAQKRFKYRADLQKVDSGGFYKIELMPDLIAKCNQGLTDVRLMNGNGSFVPYINADNLPDIDNERFVVFPEVRSVKDTGTVYIVENKGVSPVGKLWLKLKNTDVKRTINLSGSDDLQRWFAIKEGISLQEAYLNNDGSYLQSISFPASNYHYLKVLVNDKNKGAVKFLEAGIYTERSISNRYLSIPNVKFTRRDSNKTSYVTIHLGNDYLVNMLTLSIAGPKYYKRDVAVYAFDRQGKQLISNTELNSGKSNTLLLTVKAEKIELQIDNGDNLPLDIKEVKALQSEQFIVAYLEKGQPYKLLTGDENAVTPIYDLKFFVDSIHTQLSEISHGPLIKNAPVEVPRIKKMQLLDHSIAIWLIILAALLMLLLLTIRMIREVERKKGGVE